VLLVGVTGFVLASAACAVAGSPETLIVARAFQGGLGALMLPQVFGLMRDLFPGAEMSRAFAVFGPVMGLSAMLGPVIAGVLIHADLLGTSWRMIFLVNVPIGAFALITGRRFLPARASGPANRPARIDVSGASLAGVAMFLLVFPLVQGRELGWPLWIEAMLPLSAIAFAAFGHSQLRRERAGRAPLIETSVFTKRSYVSGIAFSLAFVGSLGGTMIIFAVLLQAGLGFSPMHSALTTVPWAAGAFVGSGVGGALMHKLGRRVLQIGLVLETAGLVGFYLVLRHVGVGLSSLDVLVPLLIGGVGMGMVFVPLFDIILGGVAEHEVGSASGVLQSINGLAMSLGVAGVGTVFFGMVGSGRDHAGEFLHAAQVCSLLSVGLLAVAFALAFLLPRAARAMPGVAAEAAPGTAEPALA
jgi:MFS family permease